MEMLVGLARIELATSSLSGMRSNRLSYSPLTGLRTLSVGLASLNRPSDHFFFQHGDPNAAHQLCNQVENDCGEHPNASSKSNSEDSEDREALKHGSALESEGIPAKGLHELLDVVDGARSAAHIPQQDARDEENHVQGCVEDQAHLEDAPRIDVSDHTGDAPNTAALTSDVRGEAML